MSTRIPVKVVLKNYDKAVRESYKGREDLAEVGGAQKPVDINYEVPELLRGQSRRRWIREFGA